MSEWKIYKLGDIATFQTGKLNSNAAVSNGQYPFFTCSPITLSIDTWAFDKEAIILAGNNAEGNFSIKFYNFLVTITSESTSSWSNYFFKSFHIYFSAGIINSVN